MRKGGNRTRVKVEVEEIPEVGSSSGDGGREKGEVGRRVDQKTKDVWEPLWKPTTL